MAHWRKQMITIYPTNECNLRCTYCIASSGMEQIQSQRINLDFARRGISDYFSNNPHGLRFYSSGEPTQAMDIIKSCIQYARQLAPNDLEVELQTNGCFELDDAMWLAENVDRIWVSIDAWPEINDIYRPYSDGSGSSATIIRNIKLMQKKTFVGVRATIVNDTLKLQDKLVEYFHDIGIKWLYVNPVLEPVRRVTRESKESITQIDLMDFARYFVLGWQRAKELGMYLGNSLIFNFDEPVFYACRTCLPTPQLTTDGYVSACDLGLYGDSPLPDLIYGVYNAAEDIIIYDEEKISRLRSRSLNNMKHCIKCNVRQNCAGQCVGRAYHQTGDMFGTIPEYCRAVRYLAQFIPRNTGMIKYTHP